MAIFKLLSTSSNLKIKKRLRLFSTSSFVVGKPVHALVGPTPPTAPCSPATPCSQTSHCLLESCSPETPRGPRHAWPSSSAVMVPAGRGVTPSLPLCPAPLYLGSVGKLGFAREQLAAHHQPRLSVRFLHLEAKPSRKGGGCAAFAT